MDDSVRQIRKQATELQQELTTLAGRKSLGPEQHEAAREAEEGMLFWRRTHLALLRKAFGDENWQD